MKDLLNRIKAAWKVLRGEWRAVAPGPEVWAGMAPSSLTSNATNYTVTWTPGGGSR